MDPKREERLEAPITLLLWKYSLPSMVSMLFIVLNGMMDSIFVGRGVGPLGLSALGITIPYIEIAVAFAICTGVGASSIISRALGVGDTDKAHYAFFNGLALTVVISLLLTLIGIRFMPAIAAALGAGPETLQLVYDYFYWMNLGFLFYLLSIYGNHILRAQGLVVQSMIAMIGGIIVNIILNYVFIFILKWGVQGAAVATGMGAAVNLGVTFAFLLTPASRFCFQIKYFKFNRALCLEIMTIGYANILFFAFLNIVNIVINRILILYGGALYVAMVNIFERLMYFALIPRYGIAEGIIPLIGFNYGAQKYTRVLEIIYKSVLHSTILTVIAYAVYMLFPAFFIRIFSNDPHFITRAVPFFQIAILLFPLIPMASICMTIFQALGKGHTASFLTAMRLLVFFLPFVIFLPRFYGVLGAFYAFPIADFLAFLMTVVFLYLETLKIKAMQYAT